MDAIDRKILDILQADATVPVATIADKVGLSAAPCWRRIKRMEDDGVIRSRVALIDRRKANVPMTLFVSVKTCLLYTSPSPRDGLLSRMPSSA